MTCLSILLCEAELSKPIKSRTVEKKSERTISKGTPVEPVDLLPFVRLPAAGISFNPVSSVKVLPEIAGSQDLVGQRVLRIVSIPSKVEGAIRLDGLLGFDDLLGDFNHGLKQVFKVLREGLQG